jgi:Golgi nucleoside diphosphatase
MYYPHIFFNYLGKIVCITYLTWDKYNYYTNRLINSYQEDLWCSYQEKQVTYLKSSSFCN